MFIDILRDLLRGHRAVADEVIRLAALELIDYWSCNLFRYFVKFLFHCVSAVVSRASLDHFNLRVRDELQEITSFETDILHT